MMRSVLVIFVILLAGCAAVPPVGERAPSKQYAFVVLGEGGRAVARVITAASKCPVVAIDGAPYPMDVRAAPATIPLRPTRSDPAESKPSAFPVLVCEKVLAPGVTSAVVDGRALPLPKANPKRIVVFGDTGCRIKTADQAFQACNDAREWPFLDVANAAADAAPDLVIHVGDYHYRENPCPAGNSGCAGSPWGYGWDTWEADLFGPAQKLMAAAPWIVVRGNHESCARAGQGWWRFLDPRPLASRQDCNDAADDAVGDYSEPYAMALGLGADADTQFIVFDSSLAGIRPLPSSDPMYIAYRAQFQRAFALAEQRPQAFFINHHPILGFAPNSARPTSPYPGNSALQSPLEELEPTTLFPLKVQALIAGHVHLFQVVSFATTQPAQFVVGTGGDLLDVELQSKLPPEATPWRGARVANMMAMNRFGFMTMEREGAGWRMVARDARGATLTSCVLLERRATCER